MLFGLVMRARPGTLNERSVRRMQWQVPERVTIVAEYWFPTDDPSVVAIVEADNPAAVTPIRLARDDLFDTEVFTVVTSEQGLEQLRQMMPAQG
jgi:hypothetical protein